MSRPEAMRRPYQWFLTLALLVAALCVAELAPAQTIALGARVTRQQALRSSGQKPLWINLSDCLNNDVLTFTATLTGPYSNQPLQVWAGEGSVNCTDVAQRTGQAPQCWLVYDDTPQSTPISIKIRAQDIVAQNRPTDTSSDGSGGSGGTDGSGGSGGTSTGGSGGTSSSSTVVVPGTPDDCEDDRAKGTSVILYFMFVSGTTVVGTGATYSNTGFDVTAPAPPTNLSTSSGETRLGVSWDLVETNDLREYRLYCDPPPGEVVAEDGGLSSADFGGPGLSTQQAVDAGTTSSGGTTSTDDAGTTSGGSGGTSSSGGSSSGGSASTTTCNASQSLTAGETPNEAFRCGTATGSITSSGTASGLVNNQTYAVGVAAVDLVGNVGVLSSIACGVPVEHTDFFELYRSFGGEAGGGFCSISRGNDLAAPIGAGVLAVLGLGLLRRRGRNA